MSRRYAILSELAWNYQPALTQEESVRRRKVIDAFRKGNWDDIIEILSSFNDHAKIRNSKFVGHMAVIYNRCDVIKFLIQEGWRVNLNLLLHVAVKSNSLWTVEGLVCWVPMTSVISGEHVKGCIIKQRSTRSS